MTVTERTPTILEVFQIGSAKKILLLRGEKFGPAFSKAFLSAIMSSAAELCNNRTVTERTNDFTGFSDWKCQKYSAAEGGKIRPSVFESIFYRLL
jgi:hypothetical protein